MSGLLITAREAARGQRTPERDAAAALRRSGCLLAAACLVSVLAAAPVRAAPEEPERDPDLLAGLAAMRDGFHAVAQKRFEKYLSEAFFQRSKAKGAAYLAQALLGQGKAREAAAYLADRQGWAKDTPSEGLFTYWLARAQFEAGAADDALKSLRDFAARPGAGSLVPAAFRLEAHAFLQAQRREKALEKFADYQNRFPRDPEAADNLLDWAGVLMEDLRYREAEPILQRLVREHPESPAAARASLWLGELLGERRADGQARMILGVLLTQTNVPNDIASRGWLALAELEERASNHAGVVTALQRGETLATNADVQVEARLRRSAALRQLGRDEDAAKLLDETIRNFPGRARASEALLALGDLRAATNQFQAALEAYQLYLESAPGTNGHGRALLGKANALLGLQRHAEAADAFEKAAARLPERRRREDLLVRAAESFFMAGQFKAARDTCEKFAAEFPESARLPGLLLQNAEAQARMGDTGGADRDLRAIEGRFAGRPVAEQAMLRRARLQEEAGHWREAEQVYGEFLAQYPRSERATGAQLARAHVRYRTGDFPAAISDCDRLLKDAPESAAAEQAFFLRARCLEMQGDAAQAAALGQQFFLKYPGSSLAPDVAFWLGEQAFNRRDYPAAEAIFADLARDYPSNHLAPDACFWAGRAAAAADDYRRAVSFYNEIAKNHTNSPLLAEARFAQGDALSEIGEYPAAILAFEEVVRLARGTTLADMALGRKGDCQFTLATDKPERYREALSSFGAVRDSTTADANLKLQAGYKLARCLEKMGRRAEALEQYLEVVYNWQSQRQLGAFPETVWFARAAFAAAAMLEEDKRVEEAIRMYQRVIESGIPAGEDARLRIGKLKEGAGGG